MEETRGGVQILIVEDSDTQAMQLRRALEKGGYSVLIAKDGQEALSAMNERPPGLVLSDIVMPGMNGYDLCREIKRNSLFENIPVILLTSLSDPVEAIKSLECGADNFIFKPYDAKYLLARVEQALGDDHRRQDDDPAPVEIVFSNQKFSIASTPHRILSLLLSTYESAVEKNRKLDEAAHQLQLFNLHLEEKVNARTAALEEALRQLRITQQQVLQQERMRALGLMASGVAHDFNNALSVVLGFGELVLGEIRDVPGMEESVASMKHIITAAMDGAQMVTRLREFHRPPDSDEVRIPVDINPVVEQAISLTKPRWKNQSMGSGRSIQVRAELHEVASIIGDASELREMLTNLIFNAVDAMPLGGTITLRSYPDGDWVIIEVSDTGSGMTDEVRQHCIDPFFTTKGEHGTGLGLAMVYGIIERHGGKIDINTALGQGTTFILRLPTTRGELRAPSSSQVAVPASWSILVVDDQSEFLEALAQSLELDGHVVETATNGRDALDKFKARPFDLVITDQAMPHLSGDQLANAIKTIRPTQSVIMLTGFGSATGERSNAIDVVLSKPAPIDVLRHAIARVMSADASAGV